MSLKLIVAMAVMAVRLWQNGRKLNTQLDGVDVQLSEIQYAAGRLARVFEGQTLLP